MFPNPQDALPLPPHPSLEQYKKRAKDLVKAGHSSDPSAIHDWATSWIESLVRLSLVRPSGLTIMSQLPVRIEQCTDELERFARQGLTEDPTLSAAQFVIARAQGFESWPKLAKHLESTGRTDSVVSHFERAADAIVDGDFDALQALLREHPDLVRAHSTRRHQATLLHYVSANGIEGYRQKTPRNIVQLAELLLNTGADVNAVADVYGGSTTLSLVATSLHPERAGVQEELMQLLLDHGATLDTANSPAGPLINVCLGNGRVQAAEFLAAHNAHLDLEGAAGLGRLEAVKSYFDEFGTLQASATTEQVERAFLWACEYGRNMVINSLLQCGASLHAQANTGQTPLHWAVIGGHADTIELLLERGASLEAKNAYGGTPLGQALWSASNGNSGIDYVAIADLLRRHGAKS